MRNFKRILGVALALVMVLGMFSVTAFAAAPVAELNGNLYSSLKDAIDAASAGDTITLFDDVTENVTIGKKLILDGAGNDYTGKITLKTAPVTIQNVNFVEGTVYKNKKSGRTVGTVAVKNCTFDGQGLNDYAINLGSVDYIVIEDCTFKNYGYGALQVPSSNIATTLKNVDISNVNYGVKIDYSNGVTLENVTMSDIGYYGIYNSNYGKKTITLNDCTIDAENPIRIWQRNTTVTTDIVLKGDNEFTAEVIVSGSDLVNVKADAVKVGDETYATLSEAVAAAKDGDIITLVGDVALENSEAEVVAYGMYSYVSVTDKAITIDLNGKTVTVNPSLDKNMLAVFLATGTGSLTLKDSSEAQTGAVNVTMADGTKAYSMFTADGADAKMYIESGNYSIDKVEYGQSMVYAGQDKQIFVSGGNFYLGNAKTKDPGNGEMQPWIFNTHGDGVKTMVVTGGTYNVDPTHYHGEAGFPKCYYAVDNGDNWTVELAHKSADAVRENEVEATCTSEGYYESVVYCSVCEVELSREPVVVPMHEHTASPAATCQAAQVCTICGFVLDAIKECNFVDYVYNNNETCYKNGTQTATCTYGCGATHTVEVEGTRLSHVDADGDKKCDNCGNDYCNICGKMHESFFEDVICLLTEFFNLLTSLVKNVF